MIRKQQEKDLDSLMQIWLDTNQKAHYFIPKTYWSGQFAAVREALPKAEVFVYEADALGEKQGFIGLVGDYIAGLFVREGAQSKGIGKQLLEHVKETKQKLSLHVYQKNAGALQFYQREGFFVQSEGQDENTGEIEFLMEWSR